MSEKQPKSTENKTEKKGGSAPQNVKTLEQPAHCAAKSCKTKESRFGFCAEHYEQFKFGLIKKTGERAADFDKKYDQYVAMKSRASEVRKVA